MGAGWIIAWRMATRNIGLLSTLILVRLLQPTDFGLVTLAAGFINSVDALSAIGVQDALVRAPVLDREMYDTGFGLSVLRGVITAFVIAVIAWPIAQFFADSRLAVVMLALAAGSVIGAFENIGIVDFRRDLAFRKEFDMQLWSRVIAATTTVTVAVIWRSYWALVAGTLVYRLARLVQSYTMSSYRPHFTVRAWRRIIGFSLWTWGQTMLAQARERSDSIVIGRLLGTAQVGIFAVGLELGSLPTTELVEPLGRALFSGFASLHNASEGLGNMFRGAVGLGLMLILPAGVGISMVADPMVRLCLGEHWLVAVPIIQIMAIGGMTAIFTLSSGTLLNAIGQPKITLFVSVAATALKISALLLLVPLYGLSGAAIALVVSSGTECCVLLWITLPRIGVSVQQLVACMVRPVIATSAMVILLWYLGMAWTPSMGGEIADIGLDAGKRCAVGAACYGVILLALWLAAGRPEGAERYALTMAARTWNRIRRPT